MSFFGNIKLVLGSLAALVGGIFFAIFKARGEEIKELKEENEEIKQQNRVKEEIKIVTEYIEDGYRAESLKIEEQHDEEIKKLYKTSDAPLSPSLLGKLRDVQGLQNNSDKYPK